MNLTFQKLMALRVFVSSSALHEMTSDPYSQEGGVYDKRYFDTLDKHEQLREASGFLHSAAKGFAVRPPVIQACLDIIRRVAQEPIVPVLSLVENISSLISRLPESFVKDINAAISMLRPKAQGI